MSNVLRQQLTADASHTIHLVLPPVGGLADTITKRLRKVYTDLPGSREVLTYASVLGYRFDLDILTSFMKKDKIEIFHLLQDLDQIYSIVKRIGDSTTFVFDHRKTLETIYSGLGSIAIDCHRDIAEFLESKFGEQKDPFIIDRKSTRLNSRSPKDLVCRLLLEKKKNTQQPSGGSDGTCCGRRGALQHAR